MDTVKRLTEGRKDHACSCGENELRCVCGSLIAKATSDGIELKAAVVKGSSSFPSGKRWAEDKIEVVKPQSEMDFQAT